MRKELAKIGSNQRHQYSGIFVKYGFKYADRQKIHAKPTMILKDIRSLDQDNAEIMVAGHLWFNLTSGFKKLGILKTGEQLVFYGRVAQYQKGYYLNDISIDYKLERPTKIKLVHQLIESNQRKFFPTRRLENL
ncbi:hypothetical protein [Companilactobacillus sp.]|uniref:hypothetical protein n=1 Tax=Companilactobacillus sp. TaxID=2767905 RepID=UPI00261B24E5|nr:hypothetical protein [Companilactobacillus sp.]